MSINRFSQTTPVQFVLPKTPLEPLVAALESKQQRYDAGFALADELSNKYIDSLEQDRARANAITGGWQQRIDNIVEGYEGDYSRVYKDLYGLKRDITKSFSPQGEAGAIQLSKKNYAERLEEERKRLAKGEITQRQLELWQETTLGGYKGIGEQDSITGAYNTLNPEDIAQYVNPDELLHEALKNLAAQEGGSETVSIGGQWLVKKGSKYEIIEPERIQNAVLGTLANNPQYLNYADQLARWAGSDPEAFINHDIQQRMATMQNIYAKDSRWSTMDVTANPFALKKMGIDALKSMMQPGGDTRPGFDQSSELSRFKISATGNFRGVEGTYRGFTSALSPSVDPDAFWKQSRANLPEHMREFLTATYVEVRKTPGYDQMTSLQKNELLTERFNSKINEKSTAQTAIPLTGDFMEEYSTAWKAGDWQGANYYKIGSGNTLGQRTKAPRALDPSKHQPYKADVVDGKVGLVVTVNGENYLVENTNAHDRITSNLMPVATFREPLRTGKKVENFVFNFPIVDPASGQITSYMPAVADISLDKDLNRQTTVRFMDGQVANLDESQTGNLEAVMIGAASSNINRGYTYSKAWQQTSDAKRIGDMLPFVLD